MRGQIGRVYSALINGCETSLEVASETALPVVHCSTYLLRLSKMKFIEPCGIFWTGRPGTPVKRYRKAVRIESGPEDRTGGKR